MIKTFNINLAGQIFNINEDAYEHLSGYFSSLRSFYANEEDKDEIIRDIEARFAELFLAKGKNYIVTLADTTEVVNMMGNPHEFDEDLKSENTTASSQQNTSTQTTAGKRLYRDFDNGMVTGVCSGLSAYFGIQDPIWVRLLFILFVFIGFGSPIIIYIILSLVMPKAETAAQKLEMKGEAINLSSIEKKIKDETDNLSEMANKNGKNVFYKILNVFVLLAGLFLKLLWTIFRFIGVIILSAILITLIGLIIAFVVVGFFGAPVAGRYFFANSYDMLWISIGGLVLLSTAFVFFAILLYRRLYHNNNNTTLRKLGFPLLGFFLFGCLLLNIGGNKIGKLLAEKKTVNQTFPLNYGYKSDTLQLIMNPSIKDEHFHDVQINGMSNLMSFISDNDDKFFPVDIEIFQSPTDSFTIVKEFSANGSSVKDAVQNATSFKQTISQNNNKIIIDPYLQFENDNFKYRNQKLKIKVYVPEGKIIRWDARVERYMNLNKMDFNWDDVRNPVPPMPPMPPLPPNSNHKIEIKTSKKDGEKPSKIIINIDTDNKDVSDALDKAQEKLDAAREKLGDEQDNINDSIDNVFENRLQRQHYIFKMMNGELIPLD